MANFVRSIHLFVVLLWSIAWHVFVSHLLDDFVESITLMVSSSLLILGPSASSSCVTAPSLKGRCHEQASSWRLCELCLTPCLENSTAGSLLTSWQAVQIANLPWIMPVHPGASQARICKMESVTSSRNGKRTKIIIFFQNGWHISRGTQPESKGYAWIPYATTSHIRTWKLLIFPRLDWRNHYLDHSMFRLHGVALPVCTQPWPGHSCNIPATPGLAIIISDSYLGS
jgi:hypothetical protein